MGKVLGEAKARVPPKLGLVRRGLVAGMTMLKEESNIWAHKYSSQLLQIWLGCCWAESGRFGSAKGWAKLKFLVAVILLPQFQI